MPSIDAGERFPDKASPAIRDKRRVTGPTNRRSPDRPDDRASPLRTEGGVTRRRIMELLTLATAPRFATWFTAERNAASHTVVTLRQLRAAAPQHTPLIYDGAIFHWVRANFSALADGKTIIPATGISPAQGAWVRGSARTISQFGAVGNGIADDTAALMAHIAMAVASGENILRLDRGRYRVSRQIDIPPNFTIHADSAVIDGAVTFDVAHGLAVLSVGSTRLLPLPKLADYPKCDESSLSFAASHDLRVGDMISIYDPTDRSYSSARPYYRDGEFAELSAVLSSARIRLASRLIRAYDPREVVCNKLDTGTFAVVGDLEVRAMQPQRTDATVGVALNQIVRSRIGMLRVRATGGCYAGIVARRCYKVDLRYSIQQSGVSVDGDAYGLVWSNSQNCTSDGFASSARHALSHGGESGPGCVPTRFIHNVGTWETTGEGGVFSVDVHGNCDEISFDGTANGGIDCGGRGVRFRGTIHAAPTNGIAVYFTEAKRPKFDFAGVSIIGNTVDPAAIGRGLIDFGGNSNADCDSMENGIIDFSGATVNAPACTRLLTARKRNTVSLSGARHAVSLRNMIALIDPAAKTPIYIDTVGTAANWWQVDLRGLDINNAATPIAIDTDQVLADRPVVT